jgi:hypothetical protein
MINLFTKQSNYIYPHVRAIEVKSTNMVTAQHLKGLKAIAEEKQIKTLVCISMTQKRER